LDTSPEEPKMLLVQSRSMGSGLGAPPSKSVGGTWASARAEPRVGSHPRLGGGGGGGASGGATHHATTTATGSAAAPRVTSEPRLLRGGRDQRRGPGRASPDPVHASSPDLGLCAHGYAAAPGQRLLSKNLSGVFDNHVAVREAAQLASRGSPWGQQLHPSTAAPWASGAHDSGLGLGLEISGCGLGDSSTSSFPRPASESSAAPPTRQRIRHLDGVSVEDIDGDMDHQYGPHATFLRDATPPTVIVTRASKDRQKRDTRRGSEQKVREREPRNTFNTNLDMDFLSLFAT